jgi:hypothetical protein
MGAERRAGAGATSLSTVRAHRWAFFPRLIRQMSRACFINWSAWYGCLGMDVIPQGLKPLDFPPLLARLKSCPDTKHVFETSSSVVLSHPSRKRRGKDGAPSDRFVPREGLCFPRSENPDLGHPAEPFQNIDLIRGSLKPIHLIGLIGTTNVVLFQNCSHSS